MKSLTVLLQSVLSEEGALCGVDTSRDWKTITTRTEHEGWSFLGITLPTFDTDLQRALANEQVGDDQFKGFARKAGTVLPEFLHGFLVQVFDPVTGSLIPVTPVDGGLGGPSIDCIRAIRQITGLLGKVELDCSPTRVRSAYKRYLDNEAHVKEFDALRTPDMVREARVVFHMLFGDVMRSWEDSVRTESIRPKHGPGAVADKLRGNAKWMQRSWPLRLETVFPLGRYGYSSWSHYYGETGGEAEPGAEIPVKVITVPKTLKTPRLIAVEPSWNQYIQQGLMASYVQSLDKFPLAREMVGFASQEPNQLEALRGSISGSHPDTPATLDLSDASDLVSNQLVRALLSDWPLLLEAVDACRSRTADVLGKTYRLAKFASMGSALTFPIEALVFATLTWVGIRRHDSARNLRTRIKSGVVRAYGDDIIVPNRYAQSVVDVLEAFGLKVNERKSFWRGYFRESCGKEYFAGHDITIVRVRQELPCNRKSLTEKAESLISLVEFRNNAYMRGLWNTVRLLDSQLSGMIPWKAVGKDSPALGKISALGYESERWDPRLQVPLVWAPKVKADIPSSPLDGVFALVKVLSQNSELPNPDERHLERAGRPRSLRIKNGWIRAY